jgi:hypothetical protein
MRLAEYVTRMGEGRNMYRVLVEKPQGRRPLGKPRRRRDYMIKMSLWRDRLERRGVDSPGSE